MPDPIQRTHQKLSVELRRDIGLGDPTATKAGAQGGTTIDVIAYGPEGYIERRMSSANELKVLVDMSPVLWVNVEGLSNPKLIYEVGALFHVHELTLEDVINVHQRAKVEQYEKHIFVVARMVLPDAQATETEQLGVVVGSNFILTFQEKTGGDCLNPVRERIRHNIGIVRKETPDYLMYLILDATIDGYFPVLENMGESLEELETEILEHRSRDTPSRVHLMKRDLLMLRRCIWPMRDAVNSLIRDPFPLIKDSTRLYLRDCYDHNIRVIDLLETYREIGSGLMDLYLTSISNRMNEVMKVLTVITTLFIPPTFVAGVYGMNFNPQKSPFNMPELEWYWGYPFALSMMGLLVLALALYLNYRGMIGRGNQ